MTGKKKEKKQSTKQLRWVLVPLSIYVIFVLWQNWPQPHDVPAELIGTWKTSDPMYADRSFEIDLVSVNIGTGPGTVTTGFIDKIEAVREDNRTLYTISYIEDGREEQCSFYYTPGQGTICFKNQQTITWFRQKET